MFGAQHPGLPMASGLPWPPPTAMDWACSNLPVDGGAPVRIATGPFLDPVWSPRGDLIVYCGPQVFTLAPLLAVHPDGTRANLPEIRRAARR